uniref:Uncharacterized protein n=1 Tax=Caenorhabditis japonica TaxID=281687 RepID=A0A8R1DMX2_CAEJA
MRDLKTPYVFDAVVETNPLWVDENEEKKFLFYKQIPAFAQASNKIANYKDFAELGRRENLDKNFTNWKILFPRRDPIERIVDHFIDSCVREARSCFDCRLDLKCYLMIIHNVIKDLHKKINLLTEDHMKYIPQNWYVVFGRFY